MDQIETEMNLLDAGSDVEIETLMNRIRQHVDAGGNNDIALSNAGAGSKENALGEALQSQAQFNHALVETLAIFCSQLQQHVTRLDAHQAEIQAQHAQIAEQLLDLRSDFMQFRDKEPLRHREITNQLESESRRFQRQLTEMEHQADTIHREMYAQLTPWFSALGSLGAQLEANTSGLSEFKQNVENQLELLQIRLRRVERSRSEESSPGMNQRESESLPFSPTADASLHSRAPQTKNARAEAALTLNGKSLAQPFDYFMFEHEFRGARSDIKQRQSAYLELFRGRANVIDLGCGRGEFVELLSEQGIPIIGVDRDDDMVVECFERGLPVVRADVFEYLRTVPNASVDGIFAAQLVAHLTPEQVLSLIELCQTKLKAGGVIVVETVNPHCSFALGNFYLDPTHVRPIPPRLLAFMLTQIGFVPQSFQFSSPVPESGASATLTITTDWNARVIAYQDYAVIAVRK